MTDALTEELVDIGRWLYGDTTECVVHLVRRNVHFGTGDPFDPEEVREDQWGEFFCLKFFDPTNASQLSGEFPGYESVEAAKSHAAEMCAGLRWGQPDLVDRPKSK